MRLAADLFDVSSVAADMMPRLDQLTLVRNHGRGLFDAHYADVDGDVVVEAELEVAWLDGTVETLVFDRFVGFPLQPIRDWYAEWEREVNG